jgi:inhibitor of KinA
MEPDQVRIYPLGESALTVEFGGRISADLNTKAIDMAEYFESHKFPGFIEALPAYASATIFYDLVEVRRHFPEHLTAFEAVKELVEDAFGRAVGQPKQIARKMDVPVSFSPDHSPDLSNAAERCGLTKEQFVEILLAREYRVFMLGFLPGFAYMGEVDDRIAVPRRESPRTTVPKGSVGIAGRQTGIYSLESPGGWQIIGRTFEELFRPECDPPTLLQPGDIVRFTRSNR